MDDKSFTITRLKNFLKDKQGYIVFSSGGGYSDNKETGTTTDQIKGAIEKGKIDIIIKNVVRDVKNARLDWRDIKGRKIMIRSNKE